MAGAGGSSQETPTTDEATSISQEKEQETLLIKKYGGMCPKKPPLIAKDNDRAFFDSADWALCKQGSSHQHQHQLTRLQSLPRKLTPTPHQPTPARRASYAPSSGGTRESPEEVERRRDRRAVSMISSSPGTCVPASADLQDSSDPPPSGKDPE